MSTSRNTGYSDPDRRFSFTLDWGDSLSRYDVLLALVPLGFALALLGQVVLGLTVQQAVAAGAVFGVMTLADALFLNPPIERKR